jgi:hypothetical protein
MADRSRVDAWLIDLGRLTSARITAEDAMEFVDRYAPLLAQRFSDSAFSRASAEHVAAECKFLPTYGEIVALLRTFRPKSLAAVFALSDNIGLSPDARCWVNYYETRRAEDFAPLREDDGRLARPEITNWEAHTANLIRTNCPEAWDYLCGKRGAA